MVHSSKTTRVTTLVQENFFCVLKKTNTMQQKSSFYLMVDFLQNWPDRVKCGPGRTRQWATWKFWLESMVNIPTKILAKKKVEFFKYPLKYSKFTKSASTLFPTEWKSHVLFLLVVLAEKKVFNIIFVYLLFKMNGNGMAKAFQTFGAPIMTS